MYSFEDQIKKTKEKEVYLACELYRLLKNAISRGLTYKDSKCEFKEVLPEFLIRKKKADLVIFTDKYGSNEPFLVIEVKVRAYKRLVPSIAKAAKQVQSYAENLNPPAPFFAVYNGWEFLVFKNVFKNISPYLIDAYKAIKDEYEARNLLLGLEEFSYKNKRELLNSLTKYPDRDFLFKRIIPSVAREFAKETSEVESLINSWRQLTQNK